MKPVSENKFWKKFNKFSIWVFIIIVVLTITVLSYFTNTKLTLLESLPTWEVNDPVSKVFVMDKIPPTAGSLAAGDSTIPNEYLVDPAIDTLFLMMETQGIHLHKTAAHPSGIVGSDDIVILKGNFQWGFRNSTSTDRIKGMIWNILQHPDGFNGEILVGDNTQYNTIGADNNNSEDIDQTIIDVINTFYSKGYPVYLFEWKNITHDVVVEYSEGDYNDGFTYDPTSKITYPKFLSPSGNHYISLKYGIWNSTSQAYDPDRLCIIDFPVLKAHGWGGCTIALKNWVGMLTVTQKDERYGGSMPMHWDYFFGEYALPAKVMSMTYPKLTIVDAEWTNPDKNYGDAKVHTKMLLGSTDPCAVSWYAAKFILTPIAYSPDNTDPDNPTGMYATRIINPYTTCLQDSGFAVTRDSAEISVYNTSEIPLPVELSSFTALVNQNTVDLKWQTKTEVSNYGFNVERRINEGEWDSITFIEGHGNSNSPKEYSYSDKDLFAGGSKFQYRLKQIDNDGSYEYSDVVEVEIVPNQYELSQNYPNPFNPSTTIRFSLPKQTQLKLNLYNMLGELVETIAEGNYEVGNYKVTFNAINLPSGVYVYRIESSDFVQTKKMMLLK